MLKRSFLSNIKEEIRSQYARPFKTMYSSLLLRYWSRVSRPLVYAAINELNVKPNDKILEIGYGRGDGFERLLDIIAEGEGTVFGFEVSEYAHDKASKRFAYELQSTKGILQLDMPFVQALMPYPSRFMNGIFHVNAYYFWDDYVMGSMCSEMRRILRPECSVVCVLDLKSLSNMERWGILNAAQYDPVRYMDFLDHFGFRDVHIEYRRIDENGGFVSSRTDAAEVQIIRARKPTEHDQVLDADDPMEELEREINAEIEEEEAVQFPLRRVKLKET